MLFRAHCRRCNSHLQRRCDISSPIHQCLNGFVQCGGVLDKAIDRQMSHMACPSLALLSGALPNARTLHWKPCLRCPRHPSRDQGHSKLWPHRTLAPARLAGRCVLVRKIKACKQAPQPHLPKFQGTFSPVSRVSGIFRTPGRDCDLVWSFAEYTARPRWTRPQRMLVHTSMPAFGVVSFIQTPKRLCKVAYRLILRSFWSHSVRGRVPTCASSSARPKTTMAWP